MRRVNAARDRLTAAVSPVMVLAAGLSVGPDAASASPAPDVVADWRPRQVVNLDYKDSRSVEEYSELGMTADGTAVAVWNRQVGRRLLVEGARKPSGGDWSQPTVLARTEAVGSAGQTDLFVDAAGNATVGYSDYLDIGTRFRSLVRTWRADGTVGPATELDRGTLVFGPLLYGDGDGDVLAVVGNGGDRPDTYYRPYGEPWSDRDAFLARTNPTIADFVLGPGSEVLAVWSDVGGSGGAGEVLSAHLDENGWTSQGAIGTGPGEAWDVDADGNADGDVVVSWVRQTAGAESDDLVEAVFRPADRPWGRSRSCIEPRSTWRTR